MKRDGRSSGPPRDGRWRVVVLTPYYLPGYRGGGPIRSLANLIESLGDDFDFLVVTSDRDAGQKRAHENIVRRRWQRVGKATVFYIPSRRATVVQIARLLRATPHDAIYLNSLFAPSFTVGVLLLRRVGIVPSAPLVLAPRGELTPGALVHKARKKTMWMRVARRLGLYDGVLWQSTNPSESDEIRAHFGAHQRVHLAPNLSEHPPRSWTEFRVPKTAGRVRMVFLSRLTRKKNLSGALEILSRVRGRAGLDVYGPLEDRDYWEECRALITRLASNLTVQYCGELRHDQVVPRIAGYDALFLPTLGENFGHVIFESLAAGTPVLISDRTPWRDLARLGVGWDLPLEEPEGFASVIERLVAMSDAEHRLWSERAANLARQRQKDDGPAGHSRLLLEAALTENRVERMRGSRRGPTIAPGGHLE